MRFPPRWPQGRQPKTPLWRWITRVMVASGLLLAAWAALAAPAQAQSRNADEVAPGTLPPLVIDVLDPNGKKVAQAELLPNYVTLVNSNRERLGAVGVVRVDGRLRLYLIGADGERSLLGWAAGHQLFNPENELVGYYNWTPIWAYVYGPNLEKMGSAQCLAYQGVCAAAVAGYLLGLFP